VSTYIGLYDLLAHALAARLWLRVAKAEQGLDEPQAGAKSNQRMGPGRGIVRPQSPQLNLPRQVVAKYIFGGHKRRLVQHVTEARVTLGFRAHDPEKANNIWCIEERGHAFDKAGNGLCRIRRQVLGARQLAYEELATELDARGKKRLLASEMIIEGSLGRTGDFRKPFHRSQLVAVFKKYRFRRGYDVVPALLGGGSLAPAAFRLFSLLLAGCAHPVFVSSIPDDVTGFLRKVRA